MIKDFSESYKFNGRIDKAANRICGVAVLSRMSKNNRLYADTAMESAVTIIKDHPVKSFIDHSYGQPHSVLNLLGEFRNPKHQHSYIYADLTVYKSSPAYEILFDLAQNHPHSAGFSINARGLFSEASDSEGREIVKELLRINSIDLVSEPATVGGVFENVKKSFPASIVLPSHSNSIEKSGPSQTLRSREQFWDDLNRYL